MTQGSIFIVAKKKIGTLSQKQNALSEYKMQHTHISKKQQGFNQRKRHGVLSLCLLAVYLDELSVQLDTARAVCIVRNAFANHLLFADDICVYVPTFSGFQRLLNISGDYAANIKVVFNCNKAVSVVISPKIFEQTAKPHVSLNGISVKFANQVKYHGVSLHVSLTDDRKML